MSSLVYKHPPAAAIHVFTGKDVENMLNFLQTCKCMFVFASKKRFRGCYRILSNQHSEDLSRDRSYQSQTQANQFIV